uniref:CRAL-TRIO domain-containing protein n=1 Tax=Cuerna arida TaxID=1464854 RepID=A0A1B6F0Q8_9HEMI
MENNQYETNLDEDTLKYAAEVLNENPSNRDGDISQIREWLSSQPQLHAKTDAVTIVRFLRGCKFDHEKTKKKITAFYELRGNAPEWFVDRDPTLPPLQELLSLGVFLPLLKKDPSGRLVVLIRVAAHDPSRHLQNDVFKVGKMTLDLAIEQDESVSVYGVTAVFDLTGISLGHARILTPGMIKKAVHAWQDCYPVRTKSLDFINTPSYVNVVLNIFRAFMREKMKNRVHVHGFNLQSLHELVPPSILPEEYGGTDGKLQDLIDHWKVRVTEGKEWFAEDEKYKAEAVS